MKFLHVSKKLMLLIAGSLLLLAPFTHATEQQLLGVIDAQKIFESVPQYEQIKKKLQDEFAPRELEIRKMIEKDEQLRTKQQKESGFLSEADILELQRSRKELSELYALKNENLMQDKQRRHAQESVKLQEMIRTAVNKVAATKNIAMVFDINSVAFVGKEVVNITDDAIQEVSQMK